MPVTKIKRQGVRMAPKEVPTETTASILPMTLDRVGQECDDSEGPTKVSSLQEAFDKFKPSLDFKTTVGDEGTEFAAKLDFKSLKDFDPKKLMTREPGKQNDLADLQSQVDLLHRMRERFAVVSVRRAWDNEEQRKEIIDAIAEFQEALKKLSGGAA
jgi:type VI secretion system protein ImpB